ncbi:hypothetical protein [Candidatus Hodarchaeum mangrovi]
MNELVTLHLQSFDNLISLWNPTNAIPLEIDIIDMKIGGLIPGFIHTIWGDTGGGKSRFCLQGILQAFKKDRKIKILYCDHSGNLRYSIFSRFLSSDELESITFISPETLLEQLIYFRELTESNCLFNLIIIDTLFGSPLNFLKYFHKEKIFWSRRIFEHLLDLKYLAENSKVPILTTVYKTDIENKSENSNIYGTLLHDFSPIHFFIEKVNTTFRVTLKLFNISIGSSQSSLLP